MYRRYTNPTSLSFDTYHAILSSYMHSSTPALNYSAVIEFILILVFTP